MMVAILGASPKPQRYSHAALHALLESGHEVIPVNPGYSEVDGLPSVPRLGELEAGSVDTITVYVNPVVSSRMAEAIIELAPRRVVFNPGAENVQLSAELSAHGIEAVDACTLVMLSTGAF